MYEDPKEEFRNALKESLAFSNEDSEAQVLDLVEEENYDLEKAKESPVPIVPISKVVALNLHGMTNAEIAKELGTTSYEIRKIKMHEQYQELNKAMTNNIVNQSKDFLKAASMKATMTLINSLESGSDKIRLSAAQDLLNRVGAKQADTLNIVAKNDMTAQMTEDELKDIIKLGVDEILGEKINGSTEDSEG